MHQFNESREYRKNSVLEILADFQRLSRLTPELLEAELLTKAKKLFALSQGSPYWSKKLEGHAELNHGSMFDLLSAIPVLTRQEVQAFGEDMHVVVPGSDSSDYESHTTSGSTGKPVSVRKHLPSYTLNQWAIELLDVIWQGRDLIAPTAVLKIGPKSDEYARLGEPFDYLGETGPVFRRSILTNTPAQLLDFLVDKGIKNFMVNAMVISLLVKEQQSRPRPNVRFDQILNWADRLPPDLRGEVRDVFGAKICDRYTSSEFGYLAIQCPHSEHLHALQFHNYIEILDSENRQCAAGELGRVVVTSLNGLGMPLIRYEIGDMASWGEPCRFGVSLPVLETNIVRDRDVEFTPTGSLQVPYLDGIDLIKNHLVRDFQAFRFTDRLILAYESSDQVPEEVLSNSKDQLGGVFSAIPNVEITRIPDLSWLSPWKRKLVLTVPEKAPEPLTLDYLKSIALP